MQAKDIHIQNTSESICRAGNREQGASWCPSHNAPLLYPTIAILFRLALLTRRHDIANNAFQTALACVCQSFCKTWRFIRKLYSHYVHSNARARVRLDVWTKRKTCQQIRVQIPGIGSSSQQWTSILVRSKYSVKKNKQTKKNPQNKTKRETNNNIPPY